ncbi:hypothetical protein C8Q75DRAFT_806724 [Abortiporus biennis]|nr:hypothetical protein C8Q75DRAFT_806724 [Abortiporus biennis]
MDFLGAELNGMMHRTYSKSTGITLLKTPFPIGLSSSIFKLKISNVNIHSTIPILDLRELSEVHFYSCSLYTEFLFGPPYPIHLPEANPWFPSFVIKHSSLVSLSFSQVTFESTVNIDKFFRLLNNRVPQLASLDLSFCVYKNGTPSVSALEILKPYLWNISLIGRQESQIFYDLKQAESEGFFEGLVHFTVGYIDEKDPLDSDFTDHHRALVDISDWRLKSKTMIQTSFWLHSLTEDSDLKIRKWLKGNFANKTGLSDDDAVIYMFKDRHHMEQWIDNSTFEVHLFVTKNDNVGWNLYQKLKDWCSLEFKETVSVSWVGLPSSFHK